MNSAKDLAADIRRSRQSAAAALNEYLRVIDASEDDVHAFNLVDREVAIETAGKIDEIVDS
ncbi:MAG: hypothetical protein QF637_02300, partial [Acidimicrobiales bacterium]|nr:hypothetical protein [Acidimicrobiales bacterium]